MRVSVLSATHSFGRRAKKAQEYGISKEDIKSALEIGKTVRCGVAGKMDKLLAQITAAK